MRRLHVLRHAKSSWDDTSLPDHDRPLSRRGRRTIPLIASWIAEHGVLPELVSCSTAVRSRSTLDEMLESLGDPPVQLDPLLYHASAATLLEHVRALPDVREAMLVGHNPGLQQLVVLLSSPSPERYRAAEKFPTGALATLELDVARWDDVEVGCGRLTSLVLPRELDLQM